MVVKSGECHSKSGIQIGNGSGREGVEKELRQHREVEHKSVA